MAQDKDEHSAELAHINTKLVDDVERDTFLAEWLNSITQHQPAFDEYNAKLNDAQRQIEAKNKGYRTWRQYMEAVSASSRLFYLYVHGAAFKRLWSALKAHDRAAEWPWLYGPHNGGVPTKLARCLNEWHEAPKFTKAERAQHCKKITKLCDELSLLIGQITPGTENHDPFRFANISDEQAGHLLNVFQSPDSMKEITPRRPRSMRTRLVQLALERGGIDAQWCISNIKAAALRGHMVDTLPTKVRGKSAFKTYLIQSLDKILWSPAGSIPNRSQLIADVVAEVSDSDCSDDDVRKAIAKPRAEDSGFKP